MTSNEVNISVTGTNKFEATRRELDRGIAQTKQKVAELGREALKTGTKDAYAKLKEPRAALLSLQRVRRELKAVEDQERKTGTEALAASVQQAAAAKMTYEAHKDAAAKAKKAWSSLGSGVDREQLNGAYKLYESHRKAAKDSKSAWKSALSDWGDLAKEGRKAGEALAGTAGSGGSGIMGAFSALPTELKVAIVGAVVLAAASAAPVLGSIVGGAILGGVGAAGLAAGIAGAFTDDRVKAAGSEMAAQLTADFKDATSSFIPPTLKGISIVRDALHGIQPDLKGIFTLLSSQVTGLAKGLSGLFTNMMPGLKDAFSGAMPILSTLSNELPHLGKAVSDMFKSISDGGRGAQEGLQAFFDFLEWSIRAVGSTIKGLELYWSDMVDLMSKTGHGMESVIGWVPILGDHLKSVTGYYDHLKGSFGDNKAASMAAAAVGAVATANGELAATTNDALQKMLDLKAAMDKLTTANFDARSATRAMQQAIDDGTAALQANGKGLDDGTAKGRANSAALDAIASSANTAAAAVLAQTGSQEQANAITAQGRDAFISLAEKMGLSAKAAQNLAGMLFAIPSVSPAITVQNKQALAAIARVQQDLRYVNGKDIHIGVYYDVHGNLKLPGGTQIKGQAHGGITGAASGKVASGLTMVGEYGRELMKLPPGTQVHSNPDTERMMSGGGQGGSPMQVIQLSEGTMSQIFGLFVAGLAEKVRKMGGRADILGIKLPST